MSRSVTAQGSALPPPASTKLPPWRSPILWMVIGSGLALTVTAYLMLKLFVSQAIEYNRGHQHAEVVQMVTEQVRGVGLKLSAMSFLLNYSDDLDGLNQYLLHLKTNSLLPPINYLYWWPQVDDPAVPGRVLHGPVTEGLKVLPTLKETLKPALDSLVSEQKFTASGLPNLYTLETDHVDVPKVGWWRVKSETIAFSRLIKRSDDLPGYMVVVVPARSLIDFNILAQNPLLKRLTIRLRTGEIFMDTFPVTFTTDPDPLPSAVGYQSNDHVLPILDQTLQVRLWLEDDKQNLILNLIPNVLLMFGLFTTFLGGLYVYNNQRQAMVMTRVNRTLALKNMEMNTQVTERERLNQILRKTERDHRSIMDSVNDVIFEIDHKGKFLFLNETWVRVTGWSVVQTLSQSLFSLLPMAEQDEHYDAFEQLLAGERTPFKFRTYLSIANESTRLVEIGYSMIRFDDQQEQRVVGTITDIADQVQAVADLAETQARYQTFFEHAVSGIYQIDKQGRLLAANPSLARIFGYSDVDGMMAEVKDLNQQLFTHARRRVELLIQVEEEGQVTMTEREARKRDGSSFWIMESVRVVKDADGQVQYYEGSVDDITERKQAEIDLKTAMHQSELANRSKTEFLANMSHELRTPLNAIIGFSEIIKDEVLGPVGNGQYRDYARDIFDSGKGLLSIINTILDVARIEAGERQLNETLIQLPTLISSVVELVRPRLEANSQALTVHVPDDLPALLGEELAVKQIILNLLTNAVKFTPSDGHITINVSFDPNRDLRLAVTDTGLGLDPDEIARLLAPFGQVSGSFARQSSGPGLGLTLVNAMIRLHGGQFDLVSQKGIGTTAAVIFPAQRVQDV